MEFEVLTEHYISTKGKKGDVWPNYASAPTDPPFKVILSTPDPPPPPLSLSDGLPRLLALSKGT